MNESTPSATDTTKKPLSLPTSDVRLIRRSDGFLVVVHDGKKIPVEARSCFPWSKPSGRVSLRDGEGNEVALIHDVSDLAPDSRQALLETVSESSFVFEVTRVKSMDDSIEIRNWTVDTRQGPRTFQTKLNEWPIETPAGGLLFQDVAGDLFLVKDPASLDEKSRKFLWGFLD